MRRINLARVDQRGFTLAELLVAIALVGLVMTGLVTLLMSGNQSYLTGTNQAETQAAMRAAIERLTTDLREAGYDPQGRGACTGGAGNPAGCFDAISGPGGVGAPTATSFTIQSDWNGLPATPVNAIQPAAVVNMNYVFGGVNTNVQRGEQITYTVDLAGNLCRQESAVDPPPTAPCAAGQPLITAVQLAGQGQNCLGVLVANPPFFQYCDASGNATVFPWQMVTVAVNFRVGLQNQPPAIWQAGGIQVTMSDRIRLRNR